MIHFLLKFAATFTLLFTLCIVLIGAQPYDDRELRAFLTPEGCPVPCFIGIRLGVTTVDEAVAILETHEWVDEVTYDAVGSVQWTWSGLQPSIFDADKNGTLSTSYDGEIIAGVSIVTTLPVRVIYLLLGDPSRTDSGVGGRDGGIYVGAVYYDEYVWVWTIVPTCPVTYSKFWNATMNIEIRSDLLSMTGFSSINFACG